MDLFCPHCGCEHSCADYPKTCENCGHITWTNPTPVAVLLQPVFDPVHGLGILVGRRTIEPRKGLWGLPGGFMMKHDTCFVEAARREFVEETGFQPAEHDQISLTSSMCDGTVVLVFSTAREAISQDRLRYFKPNSECDGVRVAFEPEELCFQSHTAALKAYFEGGLASRWVFPHLKELVAQLPNAVATLRLPATVIVGETIVMSSSDRDMVAGENIRMDTLNILGRPLP